VGATIDGKFRLLRCVGEGGIGRVYEAQQLALRKRVAFKLLHRHFVRDGDVRQRFRHEAHAASRLTHPNSVTTLDCGVTPGGVPFIVSDLVEGRSLRTLLAQQGRLAASRAREITVQVCDFLEAMHDANMIHRDIKPDNICLVPLKGGGEQVKVLDFGLAKILDPLRRDRQPHTRGGTLAGTPAYMAPEQVQGRAMDARTDLYALAVVLYEMLTGRGPFDASSPLESAALHLTTRPPPPAARWPELGLPNAIDAVLMRALEVEPERRYGSAAELRAAVARALSGRDRPGAASNRRRIPTAELRAAPDGRSNVTPAGSGPVMAWGPATPVPSRLIVPQPRRWTLVLVAGVIVAGGLALGLPFLSRSPAPDASRRPVDFAPADAAGTGAARPAGAPGEALVAPGGAPMASARPTSAPAPASWAAALSAESAAALARAARGEPPKNAAAAAAALEPRAERVVAADGDTCTVPESSTGLPNTRALYEHANHLYARGLLHEALGIYLDVIRFDAGNADAYKKAGYVCRELGRNDEAKRYLGAYLRLAPAALDAAAVRTLADSL
jgi:serine/threonine protein kinase